MKEKFASAWHLFVYHMLRPLPCSVTYLSRHFPALRQAFPKKTTHQDWRSICMAALRRSRLAWVDILSADLALALTCLPVSIAADYCVHHTHRFALQAAIHLLICIWIIVKFEMMHSTGKRNIIRLIYVFYNLFSTPYWSITCLFLIAFENIIF